MSEDPDPPDMPFGNVPFGNVARLHPPGLPHQASLDRAVQAQIGAQLRTMYEHYVEQPIPDRLVDLVRRLGAAQDSGVTQDFGVAQAQGGRPGQRQDLGVAEAQGGGPGQRQDGGAADLRDTAQPHAVPRPGGEET